MNRNEEEKGIGDTDTEEIGTSGSPRLVLQNTSSTHLSKHLSHVSSMSPVNSSSISPLAKLGNSLEALSTQKRPSTLTR